MYSKKTILLSTQLQKQINITKRIEKNLNWLIDVSQKLKIKKNEIIIKDNREIILVDPINININFIDHIKKNRTNNYLIFDLMVNKEKKNGKAFNVNDHINQSGYNPLVGKQSFYSVDFVDIANLYQQSKDGIITNCCGEKINHKHSFPNHYLHSISILLRVFKCKKIYAKLINIYE